MEASLYLPLYLALVSALCLLTCYTAPAPLQPAGETADGLVPAGTLVPWLLSLALILWLGSRPVSGQYFGDTANYALEYVGMDARGGGFVMNWREEWIWQWLMRGCKGAGLSLPAFLTLVEAGYVLSALLAVRRLMPSAPLTGLLFVWASLSFFSFAVNGLRNGLACHFVLWGLACLLDDRRVAGCVLCLVAIGIHRSTLLPVAAIVAALFLLKNPLVAIGIWVASIVASLLVGNTVTGLLAATSFDARMSSYTAAGVDMSEFSGTGFRWDFLCYSAVPVVMMWYVFAVRRLEENWYRVISVVYCLGNAFWIMVIRTSFSNRFAYLSWFLYPIVIAYPLLNMPLWEDQERRTGRILLAYCGFTVFMQLVYWKAG